MPRTDDENEAQGTKMRQVRPNHPQQCNANVHNHDWHHSTVTIIGPIVLQMRTLRLRGVGLVTEQGVTLRSCLTPKCQSPEGDINCETSHIFPCLRTSSSGQPAPQPFPPSWVSSPCLPQSCLSPLQILAWEGPWVGKVSRPAHPKMSLTLYPLFFPFREKASVSVLRLHVNITD